MKLSHPAARTRSSLESARQVCVGVGKTFVLHLHNFPFFLLRPDAATFAKLLQKLIDIQLKTTRVL